MTSRLTWPLWQPPEETLENIAAAIASHWNATKACSGRSFWPEAQSWFRSLDPRAYHFASGGKLIR
jgi:hypothetical protein